MRSVMLTIGPRGAGKSTLCREIVAQRPDVLLLERDAILRELFGTTVLSPYEGGHDHALNVLFERVEMILQQENVTLLLDLWNGFANERVKIVERLRALGADRVDGWYFVTSENLVVRQFLARENPEKLISDSIERGCRRDYRLFHAQPVELSQGFDAITIINSAQCTLFPRANILLPPCPRN